MKRCSLTICAILTVAACLYGNTASAQVHEQAVGLGLGVPYGVLGVNYEIGLNEYLAGTAGFGFALEGAGWFAGGRLYYPFSEQFRARLTAGYGVTAIVTGSMSDTLTGFAVGPGLDWRFGENWAFQADLLVITFDEPEGIDAEGGNVKIALGFARRF